MTGPRLLVPDPEHPEKLRVAENFVLITEEVVNGYEHWSRFVQGQYVPKRGALTVSATSRIAIEAYFFDEGSQSYLRFYDEDWLSEEFNRHIKPNTLTAIHYYPGVGIASILTGLPMDTLHQLPEGLRSPC